MSSKPATSLHELGARRTTERPSSVIEALARRYAAYRATPVERAISPADDMFDSANPEAAGNYMNAGRSALDVIVGAMLASRMTRAETILDLPCGGGRVTRHLRAFFPDARIDAGDLATEKQAFVVETFGCRAAEPNHDFRAASRQLYDIVFVGSLLTHFDAVRFTRALDWFGDALAPEGIAVVTLHGRFCDHFQRDRYQMIEPARWETIRAQYDATGFGYAPYDDPQGFHGEMSYGVSFSKPSYVLALLERRTDLRVIGYHERAWNAHQDAIVLWKRPLNSDAG